jgi:sugar lactone lactonase YvrE
MLYATNLLKCDLSCQRLSRSLVVFLSAVLLVPTAASAQVTYTGTTTAQNFGSQPIGTATEATTFSFSVAAGTTVGSIEVVTQGRTNLDFTSATGSTCTATTYVSASTCTVKVTFSPKAAGQRMGAVVFFSKADTSGTVLGCTLIYGAGTGSQIAYGPGTVTAFSPVANGVKINAPFFVIVDAAGNLFISDSFNNRVVEVPAGGGPAIPFGPTLNGLVLNGPLETAVDGAGDLFIADANNKRVVEVPPGGGVATAIAPTVNGIGVNKIGGVAVDGIGDLFIADSLNNRVVEVPAGGGAATAIDPIVNGQGLSSPTDVAVDGAGNLFISGSILPVVEVPEGGGAPFAIDPTVNGKGIDDPGSVSVDGAGDLFIADTLNSRVVEVPAGGGAPIAVSPKVGGVEVYEPHSVAVDGTGNLFIADTGVGRVVKIERSQPPAFNFPTWTNVGLTDTADGTKTAQIQNIGNQPLIFTALSYPADFSEASGDTSACTGSTSLSPGLECDVPVEFTPENLGALSESVTLTDNALNVSGAQQSIAVGGTGMNAPVLTSPPPGTVLPYPAVTFTWTAGTGVTGADLSLGSTGAGSNNLYQSSLIAVPATSTTDYNLPANGETIYARLWFQIEGAWQYNDYTYIASPSTVLPVLTSPEPNTVLASSDVTFTWTTGSGTSDMNLMLGSTGVGSHNLYQSAASTATSATVRNLPTNGEVIYARLWYKINGVWEYADTTYRAAP